MYDITRALRSSNVLTPYSPRNILLEALPSVEKLALMPVLEPFTMPLGMVLHEAGVPFEYVYLPTTAIVSLVHVMQSGASAEIAVVGSEGFVGISLLLGNALTPTRGIVQSAGEGFRVETRVLQEQATAGSELQASMLRFTQALIAQVTQTAACNRHHTVDQQLCRWLLLILDRLSSQEIIMTQELIANMLGVRREGVTESALKLQDAGLIRYARGRIRILDRPGLERRSCECYSVVRREYDRLYPAAKS